LKKCSTKQIRDQNAYQFQIFKKMDNFVNLAQYKHKYSKITKIVDKYYHKKFEDDGDSSPNRRTCRKAPEPKTSQTLQRSTISEPQKFNSTKNLKIITKNDKTTSRREEEEEEPIEEEDLKTLHSKVKSSNRNYDDEI
jgi:hypothetical protein